MSLACGRIPLELQERLAGGLVIAVSEATGDYGEATNDGKKDGAGLELVLGSGMNELVYSEIIQLRLAVGFLGERNQYGWWPTSFFAATSKQFLEPVFVRSALQAQYHGVLEAAKRVHDEHLSLGSFHLFRLPEEKEQDLFRMLEHRANGDLLARATSRVEDALAMLRDLAGGRAGEAVQGPTLVGNIDELGKREAIAVLAATYLHSFLDGSRSYPYFLNQR